jgi:PmbA protein
MRDLVDTDQLMDLGREIVARSIRGGADVAEAVVREGSELSAKVRLGEVEMIREASSRSAAVRLMRDGHVTVTSTSDLTPAGLERFTADALELLDLSERDPFAGPADSALLAKGPFDAFDTFDPNVATLEAREAIGLALRVERAAQASDPRITNIQDASCSRVFGATAMVLSSGFETLRTRSAASIGAVVLADDEGHKKRRGAWSEVRRHLADLPTPEEIGQQAARRTTDMLGARKIPTCEAAVVFPSETARSLLALFAGSVLGSGIWRKTSYLVGREGTRVASDLVHVVDDPFLPRGFGSRAHDGEGLPSRENVIVDAGILRTYLCDSYAARKLGRGSTGSAGRGAGGGVSPSTSNVILKPCPGTTEADIIASTKRGLLVRQMMGHGFNPSTGDFSRGAAGLWIEQGRVVHPVSEVTISSNLNTMLQSIDAVADGFVVRSSALCPMIRVASMTIAGE